MYSKSTSFLVVLLFAITYPVMIKRFGVHKAQFQVLWSSHPYLPLSSYTLIGPAFLVGLPH